MMLSTAYRQASHREPDVESSAGTGDSERTAALDPAAVDPANDLLWRMRLRRLESEVVRDSILAVSGSLDLAMGGPPVMINAQPDGMVTVALDKLARPADAFRRSVYLVSRRAYNLSLLTVFDQPLVATNCTRRDASAVPLQSLVMLNDVFLAEQAERFAARVEASATGARGTDCAGVSAGPGPAAKRERAENVPRVARAAGRIARCGRRRLGFRVAQSARAALPYSVQYERVLVCGIA